MSPKQSDPAQEIHRQDTETPGERVPSELQKILAGQGNAPYWILLVASIAILSIMGYLHHIGWEGSGLLESLLGVEGGILAIFSIWQGVAAGKTLDAAEARLVDIKQTEKDLGTQVSKLGKTLEAIENRGDTVSPPGDQSGRCYTAQFIRLRRYLCARLVDAGGRRG